MATAERPPGPVAAHVELDDAGQRTALLHYLLRLGAEAELTADGVIRVVAMPQDEELEPWLASWSSANASAARVVPEPAAAAPRTAPRFLTVPTLPRLGELLVSNGWISPTQLDDALGESRSTGTLLGRVLLRRGWIFEEELARTLAQQCSVPYVSIMRVGVDATVACMLPAEIGLHFAAIPVRMLEFAVQVAFADPSDRAALDAVQRYVPSVSLAVAELSDIEAAWRSLRR